MTKLFVTGQPDWWHLFWALATWSAAYMIAAVYLLERFGAPQTFSEKYWLWFGRVVGVVGASMIFAYGYRATGELERVEHECERYKALAAAKAKGVDDNEVAEISVDTGRCVVSWLAGQKAYTTSITLGGGHSAGGIRPLQRPIWRQHGTESTGVQRGTECTSGSCGELHELQAGSSNGGERF